MSKCILIWMSASDCYAEWELFREWLSTSCFCEGWSNFNHLLVSQEPVFIQASHWELFDTWRFLLLKICRGGVRIRSETRAKLDNAGERIPRCNANYVNLCWISRYVYQVILLSVASLNPKVVELCFSLVLCPLEGATVKIRGEWGPKVSRFPILLWMQDIFLAT